MKPLQGLELRVMTILWESESAIGIPIGAIRRQLPDETSIYTVQTTLRRLIRKGCAARRKSDSGAYWRYAAITSRGRDQEAALHDLVMERFGGDAAAVRRMLGVLFRVAALAVFATGLRAQTIFVEHLWLPALEEIDYAEWHPAPAEGPCDATKPAAWVRVEMAFDAAGALTADAREIAEPAIDWRGCPAAWPVMQPCSGDGETVALCEAPGGQS